MWGVLYSTTEMSEQPHGSTKIAEALTEAAARLRAAGIPDARADARALLSDTLARDHAFLIAHSADELDPRALALFRERITRRAAGEPVQYITGRQEFYGLDFEVNPAVLIPRPETELLVETALALLREGDAPPLVCDVGTGSGCIPVALLHERRDARACGLDISPGALAVAARNAARHGVEARLTLLVSDCFDALDAAHASNFHMITSNPPYIAASDIPHLQREVREHEPRLALTPGGDGLSVIRRLIAEAPRFLDAGGHLLIEIGYHQHEAVARLVDENVWTLLDIRRDLQGIPRVVVLRRTSR
jgi:release factor glutamine methyltransferase